MDGKEFDAWTRRRIGVAAGMAIAGLVGAFTAAPVDAGKRKRKKKNKKKQTPPCTPNCSGRVCGDDGCGGSCGGCPANTTCAGGRCVDAPNECRQAGVCNADPPACGTSAGGGVCGCDLTMEGAIVCLDPVTESCASFQNCDTSEDCTILLGPGFICQAFKADSLGQFCGCGGRCLSRCNA